MTTEATPQGLAVDRPVGPASEALPLVERLRQQFPGTVYHRDQLHRDAADELERQAVQLDGLKFDAFGEPRTRYVRVSLHGSHCVMHPSEGDAYVQDARDALDPEWRSYVVRDVWLSEREFEDLPEHNGF